MKKAPILFSLIKCNYNICIQKFDHCFISMKLISFASGYFIYNLGGEIIDLEKNMAEILNEVKTIFNYVLV